MAFLRGVKSMMGMGTSSGGREKKVGRDEQSVSPTLFRQQPVGNSSGMLGTPGDSNELKRQREQYVSPSADERKDSRIELSPGSSTLMSPEGSRFMSSDASPVSHIGLTEKRGHSATPPRDDGDAHKERRVGLGFGDDELASQPATEPFLIKDRPVITCHAQSV